MRGIAFVSLHARGLRKNERQGQLDIFDYDNAALALRFRRVARPKAPHDRDRITGMRALLQKLARSPAPTIAAFGSGFVLLIITVFVVDLAGRHRTAIEAAKESARNYAEVLAEHTARAYETLDRSLKEAEFIRLSLAAGYGADATSEMARLDVAREALQHLKRSSRLLVAIGWTDAAGDLVVQAHDSGPERHNIADTPHFIAKRDHSDDSFYVGPPFPSPVNGRWLTAVARRLSNPDGSFAGIVGAVVEQSYFTDIYRSLKLGANGSVVVMTRDGRAIAREPMIEGMFGKSYANGPLFKRYANEADAGSYETISVVDGRNRIVGYRAVPGLPLIVVVAYERGDVLAGWYRHLYTFGPLTVLVMLVVGLGTILLMWQTRNLAKKTEILEVTLENTAHGLCMFDAHQRLTICNRRYAEMYELPPELTRPGTTLRSILESRVITGHNPEAVRETIDRRIQEVTRNKVCHVVNELPDGRTISVIHQPIAAGGWVAIHQDITDRRRDEERVAFMAHHDLLTGVANRTNFMVKLDEAAARLRRRLEPFTVFMLDLDRFKNVNDSFGHPAGDALLKEATRRLKSTLREVDTLARLGGDEFAIIQSGDGNQQEAAIALASRIIAVLSEPYHIAGNMVAVGGSIGIALAPADGSDPDTLMKKADLALYRTKSEGRNGFCFFDERMTADADARRAMEAELRAALARNELEVHYQPIIDVKTQGLFGVEALVRWNHPVRGAIPPSEFIPLAEETGLINALGEWVLRKACTDAAGWPPHVKVAVNISPIQFRKSNLLDVILCVLVDTGLPPARLELEITETTLLENEAQHLAIMRRLKSLGVSITLDDFGTGYSSLSYLTTFPFDKIKIDRSFTRNLTQRADCAAVISSVLALAAGLELPTVAEGVETAQQFEILRASGVQYAQGYLFGAACPASELDFERRWGQQLENVA
jgi:diguanylate cyclase (GGDEF)-like protein